MDPTCRRKPCFGPHFHQVPRCLAAIVDFADWARDNLPSQRLLPRRAVKILVPCWTSLKSKELELKCHAEIEWHRYRMIWYIHCIAACWDVLWCSASYLKALDSNPGLWGAIVSQVPCSHRTFLMQRTSINSSMETQLRYPAWQTRCESDFREHANRNS